MEEARDRGSNVYFKRLAKGKGPVSSRLGLCTHDLRRGWLKSWTRIIALESLNQICRSTHGSSRDLVQSRN